MFNTEILFPIILVIIGVCVALYFILKSKNETREGSVDNTVSNYASDVNKNYIKNEIRILDDVYTKKYNNLDKRIDNVKVALSLILDQLKFLTSTRSVHDHS